MLREAVIVLAIVAPAAARAQPALAVDEAARRFDNGIKLYERQDYAAAYEEFQRAYDLTKRWEVLFNVGVTAQKLSRYRDAVHALEQYLRDGGDAIPADRRAAVVAAEAEIRALVAEVTVTVAGGPARLEVDGHSEGATPLDSPLLLTSGSHTLVATRGDAKDGKTIDVASGNNLAVELAPRAAPTTAHLFVRSLPDGAALALDGRSLGLAPWTGDVAKGGHTLAASLAGRSRVSQELTLEAGQDRQIVLELPEVRPWYKHWYVIAGLGAIVAAGGVLVYVETRPSGIHYSP